MLLRDVFLARHTLFIQQCIPCSPLFSVLSAAGTKVISPPVISPLAIQSSNSPLDKMSGSGPVQCNIFRTMTGQSRMNRQRRTVISPTDRQRLKQILPAGYLDQMLNSSPVMSDIPVKRHCCCLLHSLLLYRDTKKNPKLINENKTE